MGGAYSGREAAFKDVFILTLFADGYQRLLLQAGREKNERLSKALLPISTTCTHLTDENLCGPGY